MNIDKILSTINANSNLDNIDKKKLKNFYINSNEDNLWKDHTNRNTGNHFGDQELQTNIILTKCASCSGFDEKYVLIKHSETHNKEDRFLTYLVLKNNILDNNIFNFYIENHLLYELIEVSITAGKLSELMCAMNSSQLSEAISIESVDEKFKIMKDRLHNFEQKIIYGPSGVGKTYSIKQAAQKSLGICNYEKQTIHTVFHPESSYYDFFGKVMPVRKKNDENKDEISYDFLPGAFAQAIEIAYQNIIDAQTKNLEYPEKVLLVIDELNRGNAAAIFGGLFNLLDRNNNGVSEYPLNIYGMEAQWLYEKISSDLNHLNNYFTSKNKDLPSFEMLKNTDQDNDVVESLKIYIPHNLSIICTMNTSDQTIFSLDKAFQRRFDKEFITAEKSRYSYSNNIVLEVDEDIKWKDFLCKLNKFIEKYAEVDDVDNATIGAYFIKPKNDEIKTQDIQYTLMYYLWYDLFNGWKRNEQLLKNLGDNFTEENTKTFDSFSQKINQFVEFINDLRGSDFDCKESQESNSTQDNNSAEEDNVEESSNDDLSTSN